jgi:hypothetical protein
MQRWQRWIPICGTALVVIIGSVILAFPRDTARLFHRLVPAGEPIAGLKEPEKLVLYSIDGTADFELNRMARLAAAKELFEGYPVLGKLDVTSAAQRNEIVSALQDGIVYHDREAASCFWPRHAIVAVENGKTFKIVICFECKQYTLDGRTFLLISDRPATKLNEYLASADISLAPPSCEK